MYLGIAWFITEAGTTVAETLEAPSWVPRVIVYGFIGGFPLVLLLSWIYDMRLVREQQTGSRASSRKTTRLIISIAALSAALIWRLATSGA